MASDPGPGLWEKDSRRQRFDGIVERMKQKEDILVLFVCAGNICRSPYAEMKFEKILQDQHSCKKNVRVASGGFITNTTIHEFTRQALLDAGVAPERIERFRPRPMRRENRQELVDADLIIVPTQQIVEVLIPKKFHDKTFLLSEMDGFKLVDIHDPALIKEYDTYKGVMDEIDPYLDMLARVLADRGVC